MKLESKPRRKSTKPKKNTKAKTAASPIDTLGQGLQKSVDTVLLKLPPKLQANIDQILKSMDVTPLRLQELQALGYRILKHATEISDSLKPSPRAKKKTKGSAL